MHVGTRTQKVQKRQTNSAYIFSNDYLTLAYYLQPRLFGSIEADKVVIA